MKVNQHVGALIIYRHTISSRSRLARPLRVLSNSDFHASFADDSEDKDGGALGL
jgi:hypothetical protein